MKLSMTKREDKTKGDIKKVRREGNIPGIVYSHNRPTENIVLKGEEFGTALRQMVPGRLPTTVFVLNDGKKEIKAIVKDIQYHPTSYQVMHIDFEELHENVPVSVKVPVECVGAAECSGIKLGGFLRQVIRYVKVECLPKLIPSNFEVDIKELGIKQSKRVSDLQMPNGIRPLVPLNEVVVVIAKR